MKLELITEKITAQRINLSEIYRWFSHDVTKFQTSELLILLRFYFLDVLEQLKTNTYSDKFSLRMGSWFSDRLRLNF